jgi:hypothetical protein
MGREKKADREPARTREARPQKKRYVKPVVRVLGTVRELTQTGSGTAK